ncbi:MAG TPA: DUF2254 domain-containing protein [Mycobacteriales bacterium]
MRRDAVREYVRGSLWVLPTASVLVALAVGGVLSLVRLPRGAPLAFQGTADDARTLLIGITSTMVTVIALVLGLTVVALQLSSTQFSPRLLRNFLRDRPNQLVLSSFVATFAYAAAGLYTVGVSAGQRTGDYPRLAVTGAMALLFVSLGLLVYFADHLAHSIQVDSIMRVARMQTLEVIDDTLLGGGQEPVPAPDDAVPVAAQRSGYLQAVNVAGLLEWAGRTRACLRLHLRVGQHVVAGTTLAWVWPASADDPWPDREAAALVVDRDVRIGLERTFEQDAAFGIRQLVDMACKAMSPAVNDPYTAVQAINNISVIFNRLATRPLGDYVARDGAGATVVVPGRGFADYLETMCGLIRRYGAREPTVAQALLRLLLDCSAMVGDDPERRSAIGAQARLIVAEADRQVAEPADLTVIHAEARPLVGAPTDHR